MLPVGEFFEAVEQVLTLVIKLQVCSEQQQALSDTCTAFASACSWINENVNPRLTNRNSIQAVCYQDVKDRFGLTANHVVRACGRVAANRLTAKLQGKKVKNFAPTSFDCDARTFRFVEKDWAITVSTTGKRLTIPLRASNYHRGKLTWQNPTSAQICLHRDGGWYVHIQLKSEPPKPINADNIIGVDFGRRDIAVTSTDQSWSGEGIKETRDKYSRVRASLQRKASQGTRSTRRRCREILKRLSGRERRYQAHLNHVISKAIVAEAKSTNSIIAIEDLTGIRERTNQQPRNKTERRRSNSWAFYQLRQFLEYKGIKEGVEVIAVNPRYTSQTCHCCLHIGIRSGKSFKCSNKTCGWIGDADANGSKMIRLLGLSVIQPREPNLLACPISLGLQKAPVKLTL
ncbi:MAG: transposase [Microcystis sp. M015S2]|mgnify:CR=1 FL=1|uniref:RNA-guided endonuclease InsQ/TnpB family protein n=1 Tax=unclassified Microcystis TaxID=2643300 RepID=UPI00258B867E|nr:MULTISPECIES: transposase [unclassified Microcystis]MCA2711197.1 transposase [Microcystis sp. M025S2]MCA2743279.1 transposase [Microcystis sp. M015S2]MCA2760638.1 transposase [Microcystis sp. M145S2]MDJ0529703.1 transposase [Microcystis sp. M53600_WE12]